MKSKTQYPKSTPSEFSFTITRIAVTQICQSVGFKAAQASTLDILTDVAAMYLQAMAKSAAASANFSGRTQTNLSDIVVSLEDLNSVQGFPGQSNVRLIRYISSTILDIMRFVNYAEEIPFAKPLPKHNTSSKQPLIPRKLDRLKCVSSHIPRWLPAIPVIGNVENDRKEERWGFGNGGGGSSEGCLVGEKMVVEREGKLESLGKRGRVRFKIGMGGKGVEKRFGVDLRSGVCRGGKRVLCQNWTGNNEDNIQDKKKRSLKKSRR